VPKFSKLFVEKKTNKSLDRKQRIEKLKNNTREKAEEYLLQTVFKMKL
jgi:hypothetical protein